MITFLQYVCTSLHFKKHSSIRYDHAEYHWILYEYVVVFSSTSNLTGPCRHNVFVNSVMIFHILPFETSLQKGCICSRKCVIPVVCVKLGKGV